MLPSKGTGVRKELGHPQSIGIGLKSKCRDWTVFEGSLAVWSILKSAVEGYIAHGALSRGAAIAFYVVTSLAPVLLIVVAVAGIVFGQDAVRGGLVQQLGGLFGQQGGELIQTMLASSSDKTSGATASVLGAIMVLVTASGVFSEMQTGLNQAWQVKAPDQPVLLMLRARAASLGLVAALGFLLMVSLAASAALSALGTYLGGRTVVRAAASRGTQYAHFAGAVHSAFRRNLQGSA